MKNYPIERQLSKEDIKVLYIYDKHMYDLKNQVELSEAFAKTINESNRTDLISNSWLSSLHGQLMKDLSSNEDKKMPVNIMSSHFTKVNIKYSSLLTSQTLFNHNGLEELKKRGLNPEEQHLHWIVDVDEKMKSLASSYPNLKVSKAFSYLMNSEDLSLSLDEHLKIMENMSLNGFDSSMSKRDYIEWFMRSKDKFNPDNTLKQEEASKMFKTLTVWIQDKDYDSDTLYWLTRNFEIHPMHEKAINSWAKKSSELIKRDIESENSLTIS